MNPCSLATVIGSMLAYVATAHCLEEERPRKLLPWLAELETQLAEASAGEGARVGTIIDWEKATPVLESLSGRVTFTAKVRRIKWKDGVASIDVPPLQPLGRVRGAITGAVGRWIEVQATKAEAKQFEVGDTITFTGTVTFQEKKRRGAARPQDAQLLMNVGSRTRTLGWLVSTDCVLEVQGIQLAGVYETRQSP